MDKPDTPTKSGDPRVFFELFNEVGIISQLSRALFEARLPDGLLVTHFSVVNHLARLGDGKTPLEIANAFQVPKTTMTHTLAGLEKAGFITTEPNADDKRSKRIKLTKAGHAFRDQAVQLLGPDLERLAQEIALEDAAAALPFLRSLRTYLDNNRAD
ncbi:MAG: MarR family transcriptional regulator [Pseudomonadota bacterium]